MTFGNWQTVDTAPIPPFNAEKWYAVVFRALIARGGGGVTIGSYSYTEKGKGRWKDAMGYVTTATHWMPLPDAPIVDGEFPTKESK